MTTAKFKFPFNETKALEATAEFLRLAGGVLGRFHLVKCIYLAERTSLLRRNRPICGGYYVSMEHGPVHSDVYNRIKGQVPNATAWKRHVATGGGDDVQLKRGVPPALLCESEMEIIRETYEKFGVMTFQELWRYVHDKGNIPEYVNPGKSSIKIDVRTLLGFLGKSESDIEIIVREARLSHEIDLLLPSIH